MYTTYSVDYHTPIIQDEVRFPAGAENELCPEHANEMSNIDSAEICNGCGRPYPDNLVQPQTNKTRNLLLGNYTNNNPSNNKLFSFDEQIMPTNRLNFPECGSFKPDTTFDSTTGLTNNLPTNRNNFSACGSLDLQHRGGNITSNSNQNKKKMCFCGHCHHQEDDNNLYTYHTFQKNRIKAYDKKKLLENVKCCKEKNLNLDHRNMPKFEYESVQGCIYLGDDDNNMFSSYGQDYSDPINEFWENREKKRIEEEFLRKTYINAIRASKKEERNKKACNDEDDKKSETIPIKTLDITEIKTPECSPSIKSSPKKLTRTRSASKYNPCSKKTSNQSNKILPIRYNKFNPEQYLFVTQKLLNNKNLPINGNISKPKTKCNTTQADQNLNKSFSILRSDKQDNVCRNYGYYTCSTTSVQPSLHGKNPSKKPLGIFSDISNNSCINNFTVSLKSSPELCVPIIPSFYSTPSKLNNRPFCKNCIVCEKLRRRALLNSAPINRSASVTDQENCLLHNLMPRNRPTHVTNDENCVPYDAKPNITSCLVNPNRDQYNRNIYNSKKSDVFDDFSKSQLKPNLLSDQKMETLSLGKKRSNLTNCTRRSIGCILCKNASTTISNNTFSIPIRNKETSTAIRPLNNSSQCCYINTDKLKSYIEQSEKIERANKKEWRYDIDIKPITSQYKQAQSNTQTDQNIWKSVPACYCCDNCLYANLCENCTLEKRIIDLGVLRK